MSPAKRTEQLMNEYHLALSLMQDKQDKPRRHDFRLQNPSQARMRLTIQKARQDYQLLEK